MTVLNQAYRFRAQNSSPLQLQAHEYTTTPPPYPVVENACNIRAKGSKQTSSLRGSQGGMNRYIQEAVLNQSLFTPYSHFRFLSQIPCRPYLAHQPDLLAADRHCPRHVLQVGLPADRLLSMRLQLPAQALQPTPQSLLDWSQLQQERFHLLVSPQEGAPAEQPYPMTQ
jgi:hypothetical protein